MKEQNYTINKAAKILGVHYNTVYRWIKSGTLPAFKLGGRYRINKDKLDEFKNNGMVVVNE